MINKYRNLFEVISEKGFDTLLEDFLNNEVNYTNVDKIEILDILGEKYFKFYDTHMLTPGQSKRVTSLLIKLTDFDNLGVIEDLIGILFNFRLVDYYLFLKESSNTIKLDKVRNEVINSLNEYK